MSSFARWSLLGEILAYGLRPGFVFRVVCVCASGEVGRRGEEEGEERREGRGEERRGEWWSVCVGWWGGVGVGCVGGLGGRERGSGVVVKEVGGGGGGGIRREGEWWEWCRRVT